MTTRTQRKLLQVVHALGSLGRSLTLLMFAAVFYLARTQATDRHTSLFQAVQTFVFAVMAFILLGGVVVFAVGVSIRCASCGRRATFIGPRSSKYPDPLSSKQRAVSFFWPTRAYLTALQCSNCGALFPER
jgi:hypothetical protein